MTAKSYADEVAVIMGRLKTEWAGRTLVAWPNTELDPGGAAYIEPRVVGRAASNRTIAAESKDVGSTGILRIDVRWPIGKGDGSAVDLGDVLCDMWRNLTIERITFRAPWINDFGRNGRYHLVQFNCPFVRRSIHDN